MDSWRAARQAGLLGVGAVELVAHRLQLTLLELADLDPPPAIRGPDDGGVHQLQDRPLAEGVRDDLRPPAFFEEEALEQVRRADHAAMPQRKAQVRNAG